MGVYEPREDSYFFVDVLEEYLKHNHPRTVLDMGTGSGILAKKVQTLLPQAQITAADINPTALKNFKDTKIKPIRSNLFENIKGTFDLITFNAPYLPEDLREPIESRKATTGGEKGDEIAVKFLKQAQNHLTKNGRILILISSLTPMDRINKFNPRVAARKKMFQETLFILEFMKIGS